MPQQNINIGAENAKAGDTLFNAFTKTELNFTELYSNIFSTGFAQFNDNNDSVSSPSQVLTFGVRTPWTNDGAGLAVQKNPSDLVNPLWNVTTDKIQPIALFDTYQIKVDFKVENYAGTAPYITVDVDAGGSTGIIASQTLALVKSGGEQRVILSFPAYCNADFLANGATVNLTYEGTGTCDVFGSSILVVRVSKDNV